MVVVNRVEHRVSRLLQYVVLASDHFDLGRCSTGWLLAMKALPHAIFGLVRSTLGEPFREGCSVVFLAKR